MVEHTNSPRHTSQGAPSTNLASPSRVLTIGAHPDDAEFGAGATLAKWAEAGAHITMMLLTDGSKGTWDPDVSPEALIVQRMEEQRNAADSMGATDIITLGHRDGELEYSMALREEVCFHIRQTRPTVVLSHDPWRRYMMHPDHRATGWAAIDGVVASRDHLFFPDQLSAGMHHHRPEALLLWSADEPDHWEDIDGYVNRKVDALLEHSSQTTTTMDDAGQRAESTDAFRAKIQTRAQAAGRPAGLLAAEAFKMIVP